MSESDKLPCLYCGEWYRFLAGRHFQRDDHFGDRADAFRDGYKKWLAERFDIDPDDPIMTTPGELTHPEGWERNRHRFRDWQSKLEI